MNYKRPAIAVRRHQNGLTARVTQHPHRIGYAAVLETPDEAPELIGQATTLLEAQILADENSGCPQPCFCPSWSTLTAFQSGR
jgi:hypothetical protein